MNEVQRCPSCDTTYYSDSTPNCPKCGAENSAGKPKAAVSEKSPRKSESSIKLSDDANAIVSAQNRTTHAVRSLATFLFITICSTALGYGLIGAGAGVATSCALRGEYCDGGGYVIFGWVVIVVGFFAALAVGISELNKSRVV